MYGVIYRIQLYGIATNLCMYFFFAFASNTNLIIPYVSLPHAKYSRLFLQSLNDDGRIDFFLLVFIRTYLYINEQII